ncbi:manganese efflux pump MntP family protein [Paenibacillus massiliensis]|uniref:manganese efflux pump MntP n=1 Tax=Paenibacillus massiliensis TaxID=225917 RepID=UPI000470703D|nr:manganese efflux pump [Paenibacillus massiliensis]
MQEFAAHTGQFMTILMMALALGMDAMSLGVGVGMRGIRFLDVLRISTVIALFHIIMPLLGMFTGQYMSVILGQVTVYVAGGLLILLGGHMIYNAIRGEGIPMLDYRSNLGMVLFALGVSIDSFSAGISLGMFNSDLALTIFTFGICGGAMSMLGLLLGRRASVQLGAYGEMVGGTILLTFGFMFIF